MIKAAAIDYSYTDKLLFENGSFLIADGTKVAIVGPNGAGKSTLFRLILGEVELDKGTLNVDGVVKSVPQEVKYDKDLEKASTVREYIDPTFLKEDFELEKMLNGIELESVNLKDSPKNFSGGQRTKLAILRAIIAQPDILLLDEPTNFLDIKGKKWIMNFLSTYTKTLVIISHDIRLLDAVIEKVIAINPLNKQIREYRGNYSFYIRAKKQEEELLRRKIVTEQKHLVQLKKGLQKMDRFTSDKGVRQRMNLKRRIQKIEVNLPELPQEVKTIKFKHAGYLRQGEVMVVHGCCSCGKISINRIAGDDMNEVILYIFKRSRELDDVILNEILAQNIDILVEEDREKLNHQLFGKSEL